MSQKEEIAVPLRDRFESGFSDRICPSPRVSHVGRGHEHPTMLQNPLLGGSNVYQNTAGVHPSPILPKRAAGHGLIVWNAVIAMNGSIPKLEGSCHWHFDVCCSNVKDVDSAVADPKCSDGGKNKIGKKKNYR